MKAFEYNPETLTDAQRTAISAATAGYEATIATLREQEEARARHYYDCLDEYSYGGPCTIANERAQRNAYERLQESIEAIVRGGYIIRTSKVSVLQDIATGETIARGTHKGRYGRYFCAHTAEGTRFISCAKTQATYEKKGVRACVETTTSKYTLEGINYSGGHCKRLLEKIDVTLTPSTEIIYE